MFFQWLDYQTFELMFLFVQFAVAFVFISTIRLYNEEFIKILAAGLLIRAVGYLFYTVGSTIEYGEVVFVAAFLLVAGSALLLAGSLLLIGKRFNGWVYQLIVGIHVLFSGFIYLFTRDTLIILGLLSIEEMLLLAFAAYYLIKHAAKLRKWIVFILGIIMLFMAAIYLTRFVVILGVTNQERVSMNSPLYVYGLPLIMVLSTLRAYILFVMAVHVMNGQEEGKNLLQEELIAIDWDTGISSKQAFYEAMDKERQRLSRYSHRSTVGYIDATAYLGWFQEEGIQQQSKKMHQLVGRIESRIRGIDIIGKYDHGEFLILFPETTKEEASYVLKRLYVAIKEFLMDERIDVAIEYALLEMNGIQKAGSPEEFVQSLIMSIEKKNR